MEPSIPNLGQELVTRAPSRNLLTGIKHLFTTPKMPQLEPNLPTPSPNYRNNQPAGENQFPEPSQESLFPTKLDPSSIGNITPSFTQPEVASRSGNRLFSTSKVTTPNMPQNPFIPFSNEKDNVQSSSTHARDPSPNANESDEGHDRQLKTVIPSPADPIQEQPSFQDIHDMVMFSKNKPKAKNAAKESKIGKRIFCSFIRI